MNAEITEILDDLCESIERNAYADAIALTEALYDAYERHRPDERLLIERAKTIERTETEPDPEVSTYLDQTTTATLNRAGLSLGLGIGLATPAERSSELTEIVTDLHRRESRVIAASKELDDVLQSRSFPLAVAVGSVTVSPSPALLGQDVSVSAVLVNSGDEPAEDVTTSAELSPGQNTHRKELSLDSTSTTTVEFRFEDISRTEFNVALTVTVNDMNMAERKITVQAFSKSMVIDLVVNHLQHLENTVKLIRFDNRGEKRRITSRIETSKQSVSRAEEMLSDERTSQCDSQLETASRQLGSLLNSIEGSENSDREGGPKSHAGMITATERTIDLLFDAQKASVES